MKISKEGLDLIKKFEGCRLTAYLCPAGIPSIGYGHTKGVQLGMVIDSAKAESFLRADLAPCEDAIDRAYPDIAQPMFDALVSFSFNVGLGWLKRSGMKTAMDAKDHKKAADELLKWNKAGGRVLAGLISRRSAERDLFLKGYYMRFD